jgi:hypothetical protein
MKNTRVTPIWGATSRYGRTLFLKTTRFSIGYQMHRAPAEIPPSPFGKGGEGDLFDRFNMCIRK